MTEFLQTQYTFRLSEVAHCLHFIAVSLTEYQEPIFHATFYGFAREKNALQVRQPRGGDVRVRGGEDRHSHLRARRVGRPARAESLPLPSRQTLVRCLHPFSACRPLSAESSFSLATVDDVKKLALRLAAIRELPFVRSSAAYWPER